ncbi:MAG: undecaprenyl/decaprenyl-phosphate alpha-N-acetylglucosaminyl 1-phosphate transferase [Nitrospirae bacterium]|nr:undecaprenyl/decaprenyl-phosphate alpha-N-acetylglucosaminyl 1-phosphate transferase [Nitrospirota bacterium]MCL5422445.1 undecaprenyl/decaprenyl-phosphate alpha-N-acetylglucosaminyl 1-phosphate transferase [Nitrospirota bacterium]
MNKALIYYFFSYFVVSCALALVLVPLMRPLSFKLGAVDRGTGRRAHSGVIPRLGGIGIFLAFVIPFGFSLTRGEWDAFHDNMVGVLIGSTIIFLTGAYDDIKGARIRTKLFLEILAAIIIYAWGIRITIISNPFGSPIDLSWLSLPATVLWIIVITNAINLIDGLDGLAAGTVILISATLFSLSGNNFHMQLTYVILVGSLLGFLRYNFPPATVFMGDSGSLFLGFFLGSVSILSSHKATAIATLMIPILAFSLPLMDMFYAVIRRFYRGVPLGEADKEHIHHKLLEKGLSKRKVLLVLYSLNIFVLIGVLLIIQRQRDFSFLGLVFLVALSVFGLRMLGYIEFLPIAKEMHRNFTVGRKRKYFNYVIRRFKRNAAKSKSLDDFWSHLTELMQEYNFSSAEINLKIPDIDNPVYAFNNREEPGKPMTLAFPLVSSDNTHMGDIRVSKQMDDDYFLCTAEMVRALSEEVSRFVTRNLNNRD